MPPLGYHVVIDGINVDEPLILWEDFNHFMERQRGKSFTLEAVSGESVVVLKEPGKSGKTLTEIINKLEKWKWEDLYDGGNCHNDKDIFASKFRQTN